MDEENAGCQCPTHRRMRHTERELADERAESKRLRDAIRARADRLSDGEPVKWDLLDILGDE